MSGVKVVLELVVRRFRCVNPNCQAVTFSEQIDGLTKAHGRYTSALDSVLSRIGLALAGRAGVRLAAVLGIRVGKDTLLRRIKALPDQPVGQIAILGVDDFAFRSGHRYGTVLWSTCSRTSQ